MKYFLKTLLVVLLLYGQSAQSVSIGKTESIDLKGSLYQADGENPPASTAGLPAWLAKLHEVKSVNQSGDSYWFYAELRNDSGNSKFVLEPGNRLVEKIDVRIFAQDDSVQRFASGYLEDHDYMLHYGHAIRLPEGSRAAVLIRFESPYYPSTPKVRLYSEQAYHHLVLLENAMALAALGALIALALYNFFIYSITRDRGLFYYAVYLIDYFLAWAFTFQLPAELFGWHDLHLHYIWFFLLPVLGTLFYTEFLELKSNFPRLAAVSRVNIVLPLILLPSCFVALPYAHLLATLVISLWIGIALVCGIASLQSGFRPARYFVLAFCALLIPGMIILPANFGLIPELVRNAELLTLLGGTLDGILLAFALAYKIKLLSDEKTQAQQQMTIQEQLNKTLALNVQERTERNTLLENMNRALESAQIHLHTSETRLQTILDNSPIGIWLAGMDGRYQFVNKTFCNATGIPESEFIAANHLANILDPETAASCLKSNRECLEQNDPHLSHETRIFIDGKPHQLEVTKVKLHDDTGATTGIIGISIDITERRAAEDEIRSLAFYDSLTRLPNRRLMLDRLQQALASCSRSTREGALLFIDLDNFKALNDTLGHDIGDSLLQQVALRLESCVREGDTVARLGGDEFVVILEDLDKQSIAAAAQTEIVGNKILAMLNQPYQLDTHDYHSTSSIGATIFSDHNQSHEELLKQADIAMYQAKKAGRNTLCFFDTQMQEAVNVRAALEGELRKALEHQQFRLYYQIQVDGLRRPLGAEALLRWEHPLRGLVSPAEFIPLTEETGLIVPIGLWVLETACEQLKVWQSKALTRELTLAVNVSAKQFRHVDFVGQVQQVLLESGAKPSHLKLELTESVVLENVGDTIAKMRELKLLGVSFSMDDFGTGHSSLSYLKRLPLDQIKIDQSFVRDIATDPNDAAIVQTIIAMSETLCLNVIAEGVETEAQHEFLDLRGCHAYQGYLFGKPVPIEQFEALLRQG